MSAPAPEEAAGEPSEQDAGAEQAPVSVWGLGLAARYTLITILIWGAALAGGVVWGRGSLQDDGVPQAERRAQVVAELRAKLSEPRGPRCLELLLHNGRAVIGILALGLLTGPGAGLVVIAFGAEVGVHCGRLIASGVEPLAVASLLAPHGVVEVPCFALAAAVGLRVGVLFFGYLSDGEMPPAHVRGQLLRWALISVALVLPAALLEAFLTPPLALAALS